MIKRSPETSASPAEPVVIPGDLAELARLKAKASGLGLADYVRTLVTDDLGSVAPGLPARKASRA